jgi:hypothetical protein
MLCDLPSKEENFSLTQLLIPVLQIELDATRSSLLTLSHLQVWTTRIHRRIYTFIHGLCEQNRTCPSIEVYVIVIQEYEAVSN